MSPYQIMVVDDEIEICQLLREFLENCGYRAVTASSGEEALNLLTNTLTDIIILDLNMPGMDGLEVLRHAKSFDPEVDIVILTGYPSIDSAVEAIKLGAYDYLVKPVDFRRLKIVLEKVLEQRMIKKKVKLLERKVKGDYIFEGMVGQSLSMLNVFSTIKQVSRYSTSVLITGETGTGKEMVAQAIHNLSPRRHRPFVVVNCAGLVETLLESELFGHVKGAFTGAIKDKPGLFEIADKGTIFLDEIGEMPLSLQAKLLRVLEHHEVQRVGDIKVKKVDVRVIAATNCDLKEMVDENRYRKDLFFRLNTICIHIPPLRERKEDIPLLCQYFINQLNEEIGKGIKGLDPKVSELFQHLPWEGNVRELKNVIERAYIMAETEYITLKDIPQTYRTQKLEQISLFKPGKQTTLAEIERRYIQKVLELTSGNRSQAARVLGLSRRSLYRKLKKYGII